VGEGWREGLDKVPRYGLRNNGMKKTWNDARRRRGNRVEARRHFITFP
jgi:hypothetical protein